MRTWCSAVGITVVLASLLSACGRTSTTTIAGPSRASDTFPSIIGNWQGSATVALTNRADGAVTGSFSCNQNWKVTSQSGAEFSGAMDSTGQSSSSDKFCALGGTSISGVITSDGTISSLRLTNGIGASGCTRLLGDDVFTGQLTGATTFNLRL